MSELNQAKSIIRQWWRSLQGKNEERGVNRRGQRAGLRRCKTPLEAAFQDGFHELRHQLTRGTSQPWVEARGNQLQTLAVLLAHVREHTDQSMAKTLAGGQDGKGGLSKLRFRRLISHQDVDQGFFESMLRSLKLVKGCVNVDQLTDAVIFWNEKKRREWAYEFYTVKMDTQ